MKILINASTIVETGCTQVSVSFIEECKKYKDNEYFVLLSSNVRKNLQLESFPSNFKFHLVEKHPLYGVKAIGERKKLKKMEEDYSPDCVFSVFGPSWWTPKAPHLQGYAFPHYVNKESPVFDMMTNMQKLKIAIMEFIHKYYLKKNGSYFVCESSFVSSRLSSCFNIPPKNIYTVNNTANAYFLKYKIEKKKRTQSDDVFTFYSLCSPKDHKNIQILNDVIPVLLEMNLPKRVEFHVTFPQNRYDEMFSEDVKPYIINHGLLKVAECPAFVFRFDAMFLPTLLECFSASYPEAMLMGKPILTSDLGFATSVCEDAALYFNPVDAKDIAKKMVELVSNSNLYVDLQNKGFKRLEAFNKPEIRAKKYLEILRKIATKDR